MLPLVAESVMGMEGMGERPQFCREKKTDFSHVQIKAKETSSPFTHTTLFDVPIHLFFWGESDVGERVGGSLR